MNLRTITGETKARLERSAEVRHGMALRLSQDEVGCLKTQHEDDEYVLRLEYEGVTLRAKNQRMKDKEAVKVAEERRDRLEEFVVAAEMCSKNLGRQLRVQTLEAHTEIARCESIGALAEQAGQTTNKAKDELQSANRALSVQLATGELEREGVGARAAKAEKQLVLLQKKHSELMATHAKTKTTIRELRSSKVALEQACLKGQTELACSEGKGVKMAAQCIAVAYEVAAAAGKLVTVNAQVQDFEARVGKLTEVRCVKLSCASCLLFNSPVSVWAHNIGIRECGERAGGDDKGAETGSCGPDGRER
jgi:hypothetical protein